MLISISISEIRTMTKSRMLNYSARYFLKPKATTLIKHSITKTHVKMELKTSRIFSSMKPPPGYLSVDRDIEFAIIHRTMKFSN
jgi:hypothetical protein